MPSSQPVRGGVRCSVSLAPSPGRDRDRWRRKKRQRRNPDGSGLLVEKDKLQRMVVFLIHRRSLNSQARVAPAAGALLAFLALLALFEGAARTDRADLPPLPPPLMADGMRRRCDAQDTGLLRGLAPRMATGKLRPHMGGSPTEDAVDGRCDAMRSWIGRILKYTLARPTIAGCVAAHDRHVAIRSRRDKQQLARCLVHSVESTLDCRGPIRLLLLCLVRVNRVCTGQVRPGGRSSQATAGVHPYMASSRPHPSHRCHSRSSIALALRYSSRP